MRFELVKSDRGVLFNQIANEQTVGEANHAACQQAAKERDARSVASAGTNPQGNAADEHQSRDSAKTDIVNARRNRWHECNTFVAAKSQTVRRPPKLTRLSRERRS